MLLKDKVIGVINNLPDQFSIDEMMDKLILIQKVDTGLNQSKQNQVIDDEDFSKELPEWLK